MTSPSGDRFFVQPSKPISKMTDDELEAFSDALADSMQAWGKAIAERGKSTPATPSGLPARDPSPTDPPAAPAPPPTPEPEQD